MIEKIQQVYKELNEKYLAESPMNDKYMRLRVMNNLLNELEYFNGINTIDGQPRTQIMIECNEENNPPEVIDNNCIIAKVKWSDNKRLSEYKYVNLIFGRPEGISKLEHLINR